MILSPMNKPNLDKYETGDQTNNYEQIVETFAELNIKSLFRRSFNTLKTRSNSNYSVNRPQRLTIRDVFANENSSHNLYYNHSLNLIRKPSSLTQLSSKELINEIHCKSFNISKDSGVNNFKKQNYLTQFNSSLKPGIKRLLTNKVTIETKLPNLSYPYQKMNIVNKNLLLTQSEKIKNVSDLKYVEYYKQWSEILLKKKRVHERMVKFSIQPSAKLDDFELKKTIGTGSFGRVVLARQKLTGEFYALKILSKKNVIKTKQVEHTINEKKILNAVDFPFLTSLVYSFKDNANLYLVMEFVAGGEMFAHLSKIKNGFNQKISRFFCAQVILAVEYLHSLNSVHRDLKPENTLIGQDGYIKISDFGFAKRIVDRAYTLCGTPEYIAPEILSNRGYGKSVDWWAVGVLTYEMSVGVPPFQADDPTKIYEKILSGKFYLPDSLSDEAKDFMRALITKDLTKRIGCLREGVKDIKTHRWFKNVDWIQIYLKKEIPPYKPLFKKPNDTSNFENFKEEEIQTSDKNLYETEFLDF